MNSTMSTGTHKWNICHQQILAPTNLNDFMVDYKFIIRKSPVTACIDDRVWSSDIKFILFGQNMCENYMIPWNISQLYILKISPKLYWCLICCVCQLQPMWYILLGVWQNNICSSWTFSYCSWDMCFILFSIRDNSDHSQTYQVHVVF